MSGRSTIAGFLKNIRAALLPAFLFVLTAPAAWGAPTVSSVAPPDGSNPPVSTTVSATFNEPMDPATITSGSFTVSKSLKIKAVAAGPGHTVVLRTDGTVSSWGAGNGNFPVPLGLSGVTTISAGRTFTLALKNNGTVVAWGSNSNGQCTVPQGLSGVVAISAGRSHSLALKSDGTVVAWGYNNYGQSTVPPGLSGVVAISAGCYHSLALKSDGTVVGWGSNNAFTESLYSVVDSSNSYVYAGQATVPPDLSGVIAIAAGSSHSLALKSDGTVVAWGFNSWGQSNVPPGLSEIVAISAGQGHSLALKSDGSVVVWGDNRYAQSTIPQDLSGIVAISAGYFHSMALKNDGTVVGWGDNTYEQTMVPQSLSGVAAISAGGHNSMALQSDGSVVNWGVIDWQIDRYGSNPVPPGLSGVVAISAGATASLVLKNDSTVFAWGSNRYNQINVPPGLSGVVAIAAGATHSLALKNDGTVVAWGYNYYGYTNVPPGLSGVIAIAAGSSHSLALKNDGTVVAWGSNNYGQSAVPPGLSGVVAIAAGRYHSLALKSDGTVVAWGYGQSTIPPDLSGVAAISSVGSYCSLALKNDGTVVSWGSGCTVPLGLSGVVAISGGYEHALALKNDGTIVGWGGNKYGQRDVPTSPYETVVQGSVAYDQTSNTATFTPTVPLEQGSTYIGRVNTGVRNASGEHPAADVSWSFTPGQQANATIVLTDLSQPYDGTPKAVSATTDPAGLAVSVTYNGSSTPPTAVGSYTVAATVNDAAYKGSASAVLTISNPTYTIGVSVVGGNGSISCDSPVTMGGASICSITPDENYHLAAFTDNSEDKLAAVTANSYTIGNVVADHTIQGTFVVNLTASAGPTQTITCSGPTGAQVTLDGSASTGAATYSWSGPFGTATGVNSTVTIPWGTHIITLTVSDGTEKTASSSVAITVVDNVPPLINVASNGTNGNDNWFISAIDMGLNATDSCSGMREIRYTQDNNAEQVVTGAAAGFTISGDGPHTVTYRAIDNAGNEAGNSVAFKIDSSAPVVTIAGVTNGATYNLGLVPQPSFIAVDGLSGVATSNGTQTGGDAQGLGLFTYTVTATDKAGNEAITSVSYTVNATPSGTASLIGTLPLDPQTVATLSNSLATAMAFYANGNSTAGDGKMGAFINQVNAPGQNIPSDIVAMLINAANYIIAHN